MQNKNSYSYPRMVLAVTFAFLFALFPFAGLRSGTAHAKSSKQKLYYAPGAGSLAIRILINNLGLHVDYDKVDLSTKKTSNGSDFFTINPLGYVPSLQTRDGDILTESPAILQYLADNNGYNKIIPAVKTKERYEMLSIMNFVATEIHTAGIHAILSPNSGIADDAKSGLRKRLEKNLGLLNTILGGKEFFVGGKLSIADIYIFVEVSEIDRIMHIDISRWKNLNRFYKRFKQYSFVQESMKQEGL